jgi:hypothetical protein
VHEVHRDVAHHDEQDKEGELCLRRFGERVSEERRCRDAEAVGAAEGAVFHCGAVENHGKREIHHREENAAIAPEEEAEDEAGHAADRGSAHDEEKSVVQARFPLQQRHRVRS